MAIMFVYLLSQHFREWRNLLPMQEKYLIQIRPPGDVMPDAFREMVLMQNATNAAILFDDTFGKHANKCERCTNMMYFLIYLLNMLVARENQLLYLFVYFST